MTACSPAGVPVHRDNLVLAEDGGRRLDGYLAQPADRRGPGLLVLSEMWGVTDATRALVDGYAARGLCALAPNMFWRSQPSGPLEYGTGREAAWARLRALDFEAAAGDLKLAVARLRALSGCTGRVAAIGFCIGGRLAFLAAARGGADVAISLYGMGIPEHGTDLATTQAELQLHYGLDDKYISREEIETVRRAAEGRPNIQVHVYPGAGHAFFNPQRATYNAVAAAQAAARIDGLLERLINEPADRRAT